MVPPHSSMSLGHGEEVLEQVSPENLLSEEAGPTVHLHFYESLEQANPETRADERCQGLEEGVQTHCLLGGVSLEG